MTVVEAENRRTGLVDDIVQPYNASTTAECLIIAWGFPPAHHFTKRSLWGSPCCTSNALPGRGDAMMRGWSA